MVLEVVNRKSNFRYVVFGSRVTCNHFPQPVRKDPRSFVRNVCAIPAPSSLPPDNLPDDVSCIARGTINQTVVSVSGPLSKRGSSCYAGPRLLVVVRLVVVLVV